MQMISAYIKELKRYSLKELTHIFKFENSVERDSFFLKLKASGIIKPINNKSKEFNDFETLDELYEISDDFEDENTIYVFNYVGVVIIDNRILIIFPKYLTNEINIVEDMKKILKVIQKYKVDNYELYSSYSNGESTDISNAIGTSLYLLDDYFVYGLYSNYESVYELNGEGEINWNKTINENLVFINNNSPYYFDLYTSKTVDDETDFFRRLHACILTRCSQELENSQINNLFDIETIYLSEAALEDFGDKEYILYRLSAEMKMQFDTRKQTLLRTMFTYVENNNIYKDKVFINLYGTNNFNYVWEKVCSKIFDNKLATKLNSLKLPTKLVPDFDPSHTLLEIIDKPLWKSSQLGSSTTFYERQANRTLTPDIVTIYEEQNTSYFLIFDAKYYNMKFEVSGTKVILQGQPGIEDITKQYLYQLAFKDFTDKHQIQEVRNYFLMPTDGDKIINKALVELEILNKLGLRKIQVVLLPANNMFDLYLSEKKINFSLLTF